MLLYRVFPHLPAAQPGEPGHPLYLNPRQGHGRWDNPALYRLFYLAHSPVGAIGESFGSLARWSEATLVYPQIPGATRRLGVYACDDEAHPCLDLEDAEALLDRGLRPTDVVVRNRPRTQEIAARVYAEERWSGISWWSYQRPQWKLSALWDEDAISFDHAEDIWGSAGLADAAHALMRLLESGRGQHLPRHRGTSR